MNTPKTNNELLELMKIENAIHNMILEEVSQLKKDGGNGETTLPDSFIIKEIMARDEQIRKLSMIEQQVKQGVYHRGRLARVIWKLKRKIKRWFRL